jgi:FkbM family methyltransferase
MARINHAGAVERALVGLLRPLNFKGKQRLLNLAIPRHGTRSARIFGSRFELDVSDLIQRHVYFGTFERHETRKIAEFLRPGMTFADVGANIGYYTAVAASRVGSEGRVFAIEPDSRAFAQLTSLIAANHLNARAFNFGLSEENGVQHLYQSPGSHNNTPTMVAHGGLTPSAEVRVRKLDDCLDEWELRRIDLLKIDVEGWEPRVVRGASRSLNSGRIGAIQCEFNEEWLRAEGSSASDLWDMLAGFGFRPHGEIDLKNVKSQLNSPVVNYLLVRD